MNINVNTSKRSSIWALIILALTVKIASAAPVYPGTYVDMYLEKKTFPSGLAEEKIFLDNSNNGGTTIWGNVGSQTGTPLVKLRSTTDTLWAGNGFATMKAGDDTLNNLTVSVPGYEFEDLIIDVNMPPRNDSNISITANGSWGSETYTFSSNQIGSGQNEILILSDFQNDYYMQSITINSNNGAGTGGIKQIKQFEISGLTPVPIPGAVWLLGTGLIGIIGFRRKFKR